MARARCRYAAQGIRVNAVNPGTIYTPLCAGILELRGAFVILAYGVKSAQGADRDASGHAPQKTANFGNKDRQNRPDRADYLLGSVTSATIRMMMMSL